MDYLSIKGTNNELFVLFHGTGGNEYHLLQHAGDLNIDASILSILGNVGEKEQRRYFEPLENGKLPRLDVEKRVNDFLTFWETVEKGQQRVTFLGYSNGANFILALLEKNPTIADRAVLLHPANLDFEWETGSEIELYVTAGSLDPLVPAGEVLKLQKRLAETFTNTAFKLVDGTHAISPQEITYLKTVL